jgi:hypothetical protein
MITRITLQTLLDQPRKAREAAAHIGVAGRKPHPHITRYGMPVISTFLGAAAAT